MIDSIDYTDGDGNVFKVPLVDGIGNGEGVSYFGYTDYPEAIRSEVDFVNGLKHGVQTNYSIFGGIKSTLTFKNGVKHGDYTIYYNVNNKDKDNLMPFMVFNFVNGTIQGEAKTYYFSKPKMLKEVFDCVDGKVDGRKYSYYDNGKLESLKRFKLNILHGTSYSYSRNGLMTESATYKEGVLVVRNIYDSSGTLYSHTVFYRLTSDLNLGYDSIRGHFFYKEMDFSREEFFNFLNGDESVMADVSIFEPELYQKFLELLELVNEIKNYTLTL